MRALNRSDKNRADYLKRFYGVDHEQPTDYDLTINTDHISTEDAAELTRQTAGMIASPTPNAARSSD